MLCPSCDQDNIQGADQCAGCGLDLAGLDVDGWGVSADDPLLAAPIDSLTIQPAPLVAPRTSVTEAVRMMRDRDVGCVFVTDENEDLLGVLSERDVLRRVAAPGRDPEATRVEEVMTRNPACLPPDAPVAWALHHMGVDGFRHIPVRRDRTLLGYLSLQDVLRGILAAT